MGRTLLTTVVQGFVGVGLLMTMAHADSIQLRDGRHLQGKYLGGTTTTIGFMSDRAIDYFPISNVLVLVFDNANVGYQSSSLTLGPKRPATKRQSSKRATLRRAAVVSY